MHSYAKDIWKKIRRVVSRFWSKRNLNPCLRSLSLLLGKDSELLSKRGVDSYRADLQAAVQYLAEEHSLSTVENSLHV